MSDVRVVGRQPREHLSTITRDLRCQLEPHEVLARGEELARLKHEHEMMVADHKAKKAAMREAEQDYEQRMKGKAFDVRTRTEERAVECHWEADYALDKAVLIRADTNEQIKERPLTDDERQQRLL